jgi:hypothetical protein
MGQTSTPGPDHTAHTGAAGTKVPHGPANIGPISDHGPWWFVGPLAHDENDNHRTAFWLSIATASEPIPGRTSTESDFTMAHVSTLPSEHVGILADTALDHPMAVTRRRIDRVFIGAGILAAVVLAAAGGLLTWGSNFSGDYVKRELTSQQVFFPDAAALTTEGRTDLLGYAGRQLASGRDAQAYAGYIDHHLQGIAGGQTFSQLGTPERAARAAVTAATTAGAPAAEIATLQAKSAAVSGQRDSMFKGETLRGLLLTTYAWDTIGRIASIAAVVSFAAAALMALLVIMGILHLRRHRAVAP